MISFSAHCARGHDRQDYTDPAAFEAHMIGEHKAHRLQPGGPGFYGSTGTPFGRLKSLDTPRPGGLPNRYLRPSKAPKDTRKLTAVLQAAGRDVTDWHTDDMVELTELRTGDVFVLGGREYTLHDREGWLMTMKAERNRPGQDVPTRPNNLEAHMDKTVRLVKRAA